MVCDPHPVGDVGQAVDLGTRGGQRLLREHQGIRALDQVSDEPHVRVRGRRHHRQRRRHVGGERVVQTAEDRHDSGLRDRVDPTHQRHVPALPEDLEVCLSDRAESDHEHSVLLGHAPSLGRAARDNPWTTSNRTRHHRLSRHPAAG